MAGRTAVPAEAAGLAAPWSAPKDGRREDVHTRIDNVTHEGLWPIHKMPHAPRALVSNNDPILVRIIDSRDQQSTFTPMLHMIEQTVRSVTHGKHEWCDRACVRELSMVTM